MTRSSRSWPPAAGVLGCVAFVLLGWSGLLVPSLIRSVEGAFDQSDAGIGLFYFVYAVVYATGSLGGGFVTERLGRRTVLSLGVALHGAGFIALGVSPSWVVFVLAALPAGLGAGVIDGGMNGLFLNLFPAGRGRSLNLLHVFFSVGALSAPLAVGRLVESGVEWQRILLATGFAALVVAILFAVVEMPDGRTRPDRRALDGGRASSPGAPTVGDAARPAGRGDWLLRGRRGRGLELARPVPRAGTAEHGHDGPRPVLGRLDARSPHRRTNRRPHSITFGSRRRRAPPPQPRSCWRSWRRRCPCRLRCSAWPASRPARFTR